MNSSVDVISDVICPWCYIGKRRLEKAITALAGKHEVRVRWHPFQLNPTMPKEGISRREYRTKKFGSWQRSLELDAKMVAVGETEGIHFVLDRIERTPNTVDAHRLIWLADQQRCQDAVVEAVFRAYFIEGRDISNRHTLTDVVVEAGSAHFLDPGEASLCSVQKKVVNGAVTAIPVLHIERIYLEGERAEAGESTGLQPSGPTAQTGVEIFLSVKYSLTVARFPQKYL